MVMDPKSNVMANMIVNGAELAVERERRRICSPVDGEVVGTIPLGTADDADTAVRAAKDAKDAWAHTTVFARSAILHRMADLLDAHRESLGRLLTREHGKPFASEGCAEVDEASGNLRMAAESAKRLDGVMPPSEDPAKRVFVYRVPLGVIAAIQPWNYPLAMATAQMAPALAAGNTVVLLPAPTTSLIMFEAMSLWAQAGVPRGVLNLLIGDGATVGNALTAHPDLNGVAFTGSAATGAQISRNAAGKPQLLELGGNGPMVVLEDANLERAVDAAIGSTVVCSGQACTATEQILVHTDVYEQFAELLAGKVKASVSLGDPFDESTTMGPLHNETTALKMDRHVADALSKGAKAVVGGKRDFSRPSQLYWPATVLTEVTGDMMVANEETFGPIFPLRRISSAEEALDVIDNSQYGLASAVFTRDVTRGIRFAERASTGMVNINEGTSFTELHLPFGGRSGKRSGMGRSQGRFPGEQFFSELKTVILHLDG